MKAFAIALACGLSLAFTSVRSQAAELSVIKVCQDDLVFHTSDGADGGHISYIVMNPESQVIESVLLTGGVLAERTVAVPFRSVRFGSGGPATLVEIDQQRLISAPVIERSMITSRSFDTALIERSRTHFGAAAGSRTDVGVSSRDRTTTSGTTSTTARDRNTSTTESTTDRNARGDRNDPQSRNMRRGEAQGADAQTRRAGDTTDPSATSRDANRRPGDANADRTRNDANQPPSAEERKATDKNKTQDSPPSDAAKSEGNTSKPNAKSSSDAARGNSDAAAKKQKEESTPSASKKDDSPGKSDATPSSNKEDAKKNSESKSSSSDASKSEPQEKKHQATPDNPSNSNKPAKPEPKAGGNTDPESGSPNAKASRKEPQS